MSYLDVSLFATLCSVSTAVGYYASDNLDWDRAFWRLKSIENVSGPTPVRASFRDYKEVF